MSTTPPNTGASSAKRQPPSWLLYSILTVVLWGLWGALSKAVASDINAYMNQVLFTIGIIPLIVLVIRSPRLAVGVKRRQGIFYALVTGILGGAGNVLFFTALTISGRAAVVVPMTSLSPLATVLLAFLILREKISASQIAGLVVALVAIYLLSL